MSLEHSTIPKEWKTHIITPVYKSGDKTSVKNYRPISLLCNTAKVFERIIYNKIINFISNFISPHQYGALKGRSPLQQLLLFLDEVVSSNLQTDVIYLDIRKAFDTVPHTKLLLKLQSLGIVGKLWKWFENYLLNRVQCVRINDTLSTFLPVESGVPQGSILGPLFFLIYINDLPLQIINSKSLLFVDDTKVFRSINQTADIISFQTDLDSLTCWSQETGLAFNPAKCNHLSFKSRISTQYYIAGSQVPIQETQKDLGILISSNLTWDLHISCIVSKAYKILGLLRRSFSKLHNPTAKKCLYISLVRSRLIYCSQIWRPQLIRDIFQLEQVQRRSTKFILDNYHSSYFDRLLELQMLPLTYMLEFFDITFCLKSLKSPSPSFNIYNYIKFKSGSTRSSTFNKLEHKYTHNNIVRHFYFIRLVRLWNALPPINCNLSISINKANIYKHMWNKFVVNFDINNPCTFSYLCPCSKCTNTPLPPRLSS